MGREIRMVPPNWEHPKKQTLHGFDYQPMRDRTFADEAREWLNDCIAWENGTHEDCAKHKEKYPFYWQWAGDPPDAEYYRPAWTEEPTWVQMYETVSEGTPVTPAFATKEELIDYLVTHGDFWDQKRGDGGWKRENAKQFVEAGWAPSMMVERTAAGTKINMPRDGLL